MDKKRKNFIAFTLSEMMIVLLILSVLSAATLPAITGKKADNPKYSSAKTWKRNTGYDLGSYFFTNDPYNNYNYGYEVVIGEDRSKFSAVDIANQTLVYGAAALRLQRPVSLDRIANRKFDIVYGNSDIAFYNYSNRYSGRFAADEYGNIAIGYKNFLAKSQNKNVTQQGNLVIGHQALNSDDRCYSKSYNTIVGNQDVAKGVCIGSRNVIIGNKTLYNPLGYGYINSRNVIIGNDAAKGLYGAHGITNNSVFIGDYAGAYRSGMTESVNIGSFSGAGYANNYKSSSDWSSEDSFLYKVNIGNYAGFYAGCSNDGAGNRFSAISIGSYAGAWNYSHISSGIPYQYYHIISIGNYAGYKSKNNLNIGKYAGAFSSLEELNQSINIGNYAGGSMIGNSSDDAYYINIGHYAGYDLIADGADSINIGAYAGRGAVSENDINIGAYAGTLASAGGTVNNVNIGYVSGRTTECFDSSIHIGDMTSQDDLDGTDQVIIGCEGHNIEGTNRMCIGGKMPANAKTHMNGGGFARSIFLPPGISAATSSAWNYTRIYLVAKYIVTNTGNETFSSFSDRTLKENIRKTVDGIEKVRKLAVKEFNFKGDDSPRIGFIAQDLLDLYPNYVSKDNSPLGKGYYNVAYGPFIYSLAQAVKDVDKTALQLKKEIKNAFVLITNISKKVANLENRLEKISKSDKVLQAKLKEIDIMISNSEQR